MNKESSVNEHVGGLSSRLPIRYCPLWKWRWALVLRLEAYKAWVGGVSSRCVIEQILEDYGSTPFPKRTIPNWGPRRKSSHKKAHFGVKGETPTFPQFRLECMYYSMGWQFLRLAPLLHMCSSGTLILRPKAYKAWVGDVSPRCGIEQILED